MKPLYLFIASFVLLGFAGVSFNWTDPNRPVLIEILGAIGIFVWLPLLIVAIVWTRVANGRGPSGSSTTPEAEALKPASVTTPTSQPVIQAGRGKPKLITPLRLFLIGIVAAACAVAVLEFGPTDPSDLQIILLAISSTTALVATFTSVVWAIFRWRFGQG